MFLWSSNHLKSLQMDWKRCWRCLPNTSINTLQPLCRWWQLSPLIMSKFRHTVSCSFFMRSFLLPCMTLHEPIKLARQCSHQIFFLSKRDTKVLYILSVVTDGILSFPQKKKKKKNDTKAVRIFCNQLLVASSIFKEKYVSWRSDICFSSIYLPNPNLILYDAAVLDDWVWIKALQSFDNFFVISIISPVHANERFFQHNMAEPRHLDLMLYLLLTYLGLVEELLWWNFNILD